MRRKVALVVLVMTAIASVATERAVCDDARLPRRGDRAWDPNAPLLLGFPDNVPPHDTAGLLSKIHVATADGREARLVAASHDNTLVLCPVGGLEPDTDYVWEVAPLGSDSPNHVRVPDFDRTGVWRFHTAVTSALVAATNERECVRVAERASPSYTCGDSADTGIDETDETDETVDSDTDTVGDTE